MAAQTSLLISESTKMHCDLLEKAFISVQQRFRVVASASTPVQIMSELHGNRPQVALINSDLLDGPRSGFRMLPDICRTYPAMKMILMLAPGDAELVPDAFRFGAMGVFSKSASFDSLCKAIEVVSKGQIWANAEELRAVMGAFVKAPKLPKLDPTVEKRVTRREAAVVRLAIEGLSNREIAQRLSLSEHTVKNYMFRVFDKLGVSNRVELVLSCLNLETQSGEMAAEGLLPVQKLLVEDNVLEAEV
jgi:DNA-binding NarL/FixJ family response regulator